MTTRNVTAVLLAILLFSSSVFAKDPILEPNLKWWVVLGLDAEEAKTIAPPFAAAISRRVRRDRQPSLSQFQIEILDKADADMAKFLNLSKVDRALEVSNWKAAGGEKIYSTHKPADPKPSPQIPPSAARTLPASAPVPENTFVQDEIARMLAEKATTGANAPVETLRRISEHFGADTSRKISPADLEALASLKEMHRYQLEAQLPQTIDRVRFSQELLKLKALFGDLGREKAHVAKVNKIHGLSTDFLGDALAPKSSDRRLTPDEYLDAFVTRHNAARTIEPEFIEKLYGIAIANYPGKNFAEDLMEKKSDALFAEPGRMKFLAMNLRRSGSEKVGELITNGIVNALEALDKETEASRLRDLKYSTLYDIAQQHADRFLASFPHASDNARQRTFALAVRSMAPASLNAFVKKHLPENPEEQSGFFKQLIEHYGDTALRSPETANPFLRLMNQILVPANEAEAKRALETFQLARDKMKAHGVQDRVTPSILQSREFAIEKAEHDGSYGNEQARRALRLTIAYPEIEQASRDPRREEGIFNRIDGKYRARAGDMRKATKIDEDDIRQLGEFVTNHPDLGEDLTTNQKLDLARSISAMEDNFGANADKRSPVIAKAWDAIHSKSTELFGSVIEDTQDMGTFLDALCNRFNSARSANLDFIKMLMEIGLERYSRLKRKPAASVQLEFLEAVLNHSHGINNENVLFNAEKAKMLLDIIVKNHGGVFNFTPVERARAISLAQAAMEKTLEEEEKLPSIARERLDNLRKETAGEGKIPATTKEVLHGLARHLLGGFASKDVDKARALAVALSTLPSEAPDVRRFLEEALPGKAEQRLAALQQALKLYPRVAFSNPDVVRGVLTYLNQAFPEPSNSEAKAVRAVLEEAKKAIKDLASTSKGAEERLYENFHREATVAHEEIDAKCGIFRRLFRKAK